MGPAASGPASNGLLGVVAELNRSQTSKAVLSVRHFVHFALPAETTRQDAAGAATREIGQDNAAVSAKSAAIRHVVNLGFTLLGVWHEKNFSARWMPGNSLSRVVSNRSTQDRAGTHSEPESHDATSRLASAQRSPPMSLPGVKEGPPQSGGQTQTAGSIDESG